MCDWLRKYKTSELSDPIRILHYKFEISYMCIELDHLCSVMACHLHDTNLLHEPMLTLSQFEH